MSSNEKDTTVPSSSSDTASPPRREPFFESARRFSDMQFSHILHSLMGIPSNISPPNTSNWAIVDDDHEIPSPSSNNDDNPRTQRSDSLVGEIRHHDSSSSPDNNGKSGGSGVGILGCIKTETFVPKSAETERRERERVASSLWDSTWLSPPTAGLLWGGDDPFGILRRAECMQREAESLLSRLLMAQEGDSAGQSLPGETELDYYKFFERQYARSSGMECTTAEAERRVVQELTETRSFTGTDGVTRTKRVQVKRYGDGTEERTAVEDVTYPRSLSSSGGRIVEVEDRSGNSRSEILDAVKEGK
jgi:hypothetical protein